MELMRIQRVGIEGVFPWTALAVVWCLVLGVILACTLVSQGGDTDGGYKFEKELHIELRTEPQKKS